MRLDKLSLQFAMHDTNLISDVLEAYERLILDAMRADRTLFTTAEGIERLWEVSKPLLEMPPPVRLYEPGSWGPKSVHQLIAPHAWRLPFERAWRDPNPLAADGAAVALSAIGLSWEVEQAGLPKPPSPIGRVEMQLALAGIFVLALLALFVGPALAARSTTVVAPTIVAPAVDAFDKGIKLDSWVKGAIKIITPGQHPQVEVHVGEVRRRDGCRYGRKQRCIVNQRELGAG